MSAPNRTYVLNPWPQFFPVEHHNLFLVSASLKINEIILFFIDYTSESITTHIKHARSYGKRIDTVATVEKGQDSSNILEDTAV